MKTLPAAGIRLLLTLCGSALACDSSSQGGRAESPATDASASASASASTETSTPAWIGAFGEEQRVGELFLSVRLVITPGQAEYSATSTRNGELFIQQTCTAPLTVANETPVVSMFDCEISANGNRMTKQIAFDLSFNGEAWVRRDKGEETILSRI
jgi:hypothetical protein